MPNEKIRLYFSKLQQALADLPVIIGNEAVNYTLEAFEKQSWEGVPWQQRQSKKDSSRALLVKSGRLKRSIRVISSTASSVIIGTDVAYAAVHNEGGLISRAARSETFIRNRYSKGTRKGAFKKGTVAGKGHTYKSYSFRMPRRRFLGDTPELRERIRDRVIQEIKQVTQTT